MGSNKVQVFEDLKRKYVRMALETNQYASTAKAAGVSRETFRKWMREYETEILDQMEQEGRVVVGPEPTETGYKKKYELAMKLLGEKELEVAVLKDALKKNTPL